MRHRILIVSLLCLALFALSALAHASPPDETWQPGLYDDADFDDVIALIISLSGSVTDSSFDSLRLVSAFHGIVLATGPDDLPARPTRPDTSRSPPSS